MKKIAVFNGPNLHRLGQREPEIYGKTTLTELEQHLQNKAKKHPVTLSFLQTNHEGELIDAIYEAADQGVSYFIVNAGAWTHTSIALRDALQAVRIPFIEVHLSNIFAREAFRQSSLLSDIARGIICGLGIQSYDLALQFILENDSILSSE